MTVREISDRIDWVLSKTSGGIILDEYEKSVYMTSSQDLYVNSMLSTYEYGDYIRHILGKLILEDTKVASDIISSGSGYVELPLNTDINRILYEETNSGMKTIPMDYNDIHDTINNPFRTPDPSIAYRVTSDNKIKLYTSETFINYLYIYCKIPGPIVLEALPDSLEIMGVSTPTESELPTGSILKVIDIASKMIFEDKARFMKKQEPEKRNN